MASTTAIGNARRVNRAILAATVGFSAAALIGLLAMMLLLSPVPRGHAAIVYGISLLLCSLFSFLYNTREASRHRRLLRYCDHGAIFLLIAGTYTPFVAGGVPGPFGISLLIWVWALALLGIALKLVLHDRHDRFFVVLYLALGWLFVFAAGPFIDFNPLSSLIFLSIGAVSYSVGAVIYGRGIGNWTDPVWHGCVLTGSGTHFVAVVLLMLQPGIA